MRSHRVGAGTRRSTGSQNQKVVAKLRTLAQQGDLDQPAGALGDLSKLIRYIHQSPEMSATDKRQLIDSAYFQMIGIAKGGNEILDAIEDQSGMRGRT